MIEQRAVYGEAQREGRTVSAEIEVIHQYEPNLVQAPGASGYKDLGRRHPTLVRFLDVDGEFAAELHKLVAGHSGDAHARRRFRDSGWAPRPIDIVTTDGTTYQGCHVRAPINPYGPLEELHFMLAHERL
jgi:hypothetical protein